MANVELTNICMVYDKSNNKVLVQERIKSWKGIAFPGGHIEDGESIVDSTIREIKEETGLDITNLKPCGVLHWYNDETRERYFVFCFKTDTFTGNIIKETSEGKVFWIDKDELYNLKFANGFAEQLQIFFTDKICEGFTTWNQSENGEISWR